MSPPNMFLALFQMVFDLGYKAKSNSYSRVDPFLKRVFIVKNKPRPGCSSLDWLGHFALVLQVCRVASGQRLPSRQSRHWSIRVFPKIPTKIDYSGGCLSPKCDLTHIPMGDIQLYPPIKKLSKASSYWGQKSSESRQVCSRLKTPRRQKVAVADGDLFVDQNSGRIGRVESLGKCWENWFQKWWIDESVSIATTRSLGEGAQPRSWQAVLEEQSPSS